MSEKRISESDLQAISEVLGDANEGLAETEIAEILDICQIKDEFTDEAKARPHLFQPLPSLRPGVWERS